MYIADFGSGSGAIAVIFAQAVGADGRVTALDVLPSAQESVLAKAKHHHLENISAIRANLEVLWGSTLPEHSQDIVFLGNILWQSEKKGDILAEAARVLKPSGRIMVLEWKNGGGAICPPEKLCISEDDLRQALEKAGFKVTETFGAGAFHYGVIAHH